MKPSINQKLFLFQKTNKTKSHWMKTKISKKKIFDLPDGFHRYKNNLHLIDIQTILMADNNGAQAIAFYKRTSELNPFHRTQIISVIIDYVLNAKIWIEKQQFPELTAKILSFFRTGNPNEYVS